MPETDVTRRRLCRVAASAMGLLGTLSLAGCQGSGSDGDDGLELDGEDQQTTDTGDLSDPLEPEPDPPSASFTWDFAVGSTPEENKLVITMDSANQEIMASELIVSGDLGDGEQIDLESWSELGDFDPSDEVTAGDSLELAHQQTIGDRVVTRAFDLRVVYEPSEGGSSTTLSSNSGPDA